MTNSNKSSVIAIDGPSGSGKSTMAKKLAEKLNVLFIDTGAMFRALACYCDDHQIPMEDGEALNNFLNTIDFQYGIDEQTLVKVNGENLTKKIREHQVSRLASIISQIPSVRKFLLDFQRSLPKQRVCVMEGRDIGTVVFPDAFCKFFITASVEIRSDRRLKQLQEAGDTDVTMEQVIMDVIKRDESDTNREVSPLRQAVDAEFVDTSDHSEDEILKYLTEQTLKKKAEYGIQL